MDWADTSSTFLVQTTPAVSAAGQIWAQVLFPEMKKSSCRLEQISDDPLDGDVADRLPEEDGLQGLGGELRQRRQGQQEPPEPDSVGR